MFYLDVFIKKGTIEFKNNKLKIDLLLDIYNYGLDTVKTQFCPRIFI